MDCTPCRELRSPPHSAHRALRPGWQHCTLLPPAHRTEPTGSVLCGIPVLCAAIQLGIQLGSCVVVVVVWGGAFMNKDATAAVGGPAVHAGQATHTEAHAHAHPIMHTHPLRCASWVRVGPSGGVRSLQASLHAGAVHHLRKRVRVAHVTLLNEE